MSDLIVIAVDGPAASGKGTLSRRAAARYRLGYLDTGLLYRAVAARVLDAGGDPADAAASTRAAEGLSAVDLDRTDLRTAGAGAAASFVAAHPPVRAALLAYQRDFAANPGDGLRGAILDGRDIGTVVCPNARLKVFVTASSDERARRRWLELRRTDPDAPIDQVRADIAARDERDQNRSASPLVAAADAVLLDTTDLDIDRAVAAFEALVDPIAG